MSTAEATELTDVLNRVNAWPTTLRITLARKILESLDNAQAPAAPPHQKGRGLSAAEVQSLLKTDRPRRMTRQSNDGSMSVRWRNTAYEASGQEGTGDGGGAGIGRGCALELARAGADVAVNDRERTAQAEAVVAEIQALGRQAVLVEGDVFERASCESVVSARSRHLGASTSS